MKRVLLAIAASCALSGTFAQAPPPLAFKDLVLGAPLGDGPMAKRLNCSSTSCSYYGLGGGRETIGGALIKILSVKLDEDRIDSILIVFPSTAYAAVRDGFKEKYALKCEQSAVQNRMGASFDQETCRYDDGVGSLSLSKRASTVDDASAYFVSHKAIERAKSERSKATKDL